MIQTTVKLLNGELLTVEHMPSMICLKQAIQKVYPEMYEECQVITPYNTENNMYILTVDTVENAITIQLEKSMDVVINTHPHRIQNYDVNELIHYIDNYHFSYEHIIHAHLVSIGCKSIHNKLGIGYFFHPIFHPNKGFTSSYMMHYPDIETITGDGIREDWYVPKEEDETKIWFPTFRALFDVLKTQQTFPFPEIYHNEVFLDKVEEAFREYGNSFVIR